jgi:hypothetical protein
VIADTAIAVVGLIAVVGNADQSAKKAMGQPDSSNSTPAMQSCAPIGTKIDLFARLIGTQPADD